ncbi:HPP family protein [Nitratireductor indicus]|uniref:HPP family protein n=1 Tax=Nitratireductor indicus TaxID=721133 RepID=UPI00030C36C3|nr:HPP family protein [Nitratireductor indicus]SFQ16773.1 CBS domain-containing membrane protein [Nitratireductor indicus]
MLRFLKAFGPAVARTKPSEALRAGAGAFLGLALCGLFALTPAINLNLGLYLIAPFGASSVLLFAVPNSPLAQPWSAICGNTIAALVGVAVCLLVDEPVLRIALSVGLAIMAMILCRAVHPPAGAVAMTAAMNPDTIAELGFRFALTPVASGTTLLVLIAILYARMTGRRYPFRQFDEPNRHGTADRPPFERLGLTSEELTDILRRYRQSFNLGVEDLARLIGAAEMQAASHRVTPVVAADLMSRDLVTVNPQASLAEITALFERHRFTSLPVETTDRRFVGIIFQIHLLIQDRGADAPIFSRRRRRLKAQDIMETTSPRAAPSTPLAALVHLMAESEVDAVPVIEDERIVGVVTRTDLIATLARSSLS